MASFSSLLYQKLNFKFKFKFLKFIFSAGTTGHDMYTLVVATHALKNDTKDMYVGECQDPTSLDPSLIKGNLLVCSYSVRFVLGLSSVKQALETAKNVSAVGVVFYLDPFVIGFQLNPTPMHIPGLIIPSSDDSKVLKSSI
jgi:hypothetical protein